MEMPGQHPHPKTHIENFEGSEHELKRAGFVYVLLQTRDVEQAKQLSGLGEHALQRLIERWGEAGTVKDRPRSGRPTAYGTEVMSKAYDTLVGYEEGFLTGGELLRMLTVQGAVRETVDPDNFMRHFREYVKSRGHILIVNSTKTIFFLTIHDVVDRVKFATRLLPQITEEKERMLIFVDETTLEKDPHPKGGMCKAASWCIGKHACMVS
jgi:hypothetical protein